MLLAVVAIVSSRTLDRATFRRLMSVVGRAFAVGSAIAWLLIAVSGVAMAWPRLGYSLSGLSTSFGHLLEAKTGLAAVAVVLTGVHTLAGRRPDSRGATTLSRAISPILFVLTVAIFWLAVRMTEG